ncbi:hypothetical protein BJV77DRAFT_1039532, partial [Russula vinacea]
MSSMSTSLLVVFPTSAVYNRTWMSALTPIRSRTFAHGQRHHRQSREAGRLQYQRLMSSGMLGWCELDLVHVWPKFWHGCLPASPYPINTIRQLFTDRAAPPKVTAPTGIQVVAANIRHGSRIFSLLSLLFHMLTRE